MSITTSNRDHAAGNYAPIQLHPDVEVQRTPWSSSSLKSNCRSYLGRVSPTSRCGIDPGTLVSSKDKTAKFTCSVTSVRWAELLFKTAGDDYDSSLLCPGVHKDLFQEIGNDPEEDLNTKPRCLATDVPTGRGHFEDAGHHWFLTGCWVQVGECGDKNKSSQFPQIQVE